MTEEHQAMQFSDSLTVSAPIDRVWSMLIDAHSIGSCIPGLENLEIDEENASFGGIARINLGATALAFPARITWVEQIAPQGGRLRAQVKVAGYEIVGNGTVDLSSHESDGTAINWRANVIMPEQLAGNKLMVQTARMFAGRFIQSFFGCLLERLAAV